MVTYGGYPNRTFSRLHNLHKPRVPHHCYCLFLTLPALHHPHPLLPSFLTVHTQNLQHSSFLYYLFLFYPISIFHTAGPIFYFTLPQLLILYTAHFPLLSFLTPHFLLSADMYIPVAHGLLYVPFSILYTLFVNSLSVIPNYTHLFSTPLTFLTSFIHSSFVRTPHSTFHVFHKNRGVCVGWGGGLNFDPKGN